MKAKIVILIVMAAAILFAAVALANGGPSIERYVIGGGGGHSEAGSYALDSTIGQAVIGVTSANGYELCSGFWCGAAVEYKIYLPLVLRNA